MNVNYIIFHMPFWIFTWIENYVVTELTAWLFLYRLLSRRMKGQQIIFNISFLELCRCSITIAIFVQNASFWCNACLFNLCICIYFLSLDISFRGTFLKYSLKVENHTESCTWLPRPVLWCEVSNLENNYTSGLS